MSVASHFRRSLQKRAVELLSIGGMDAAEVALVLGLSDRHVRRLRARSAKGRRRLRALAKRSRPAEDLIPDAGCSGDELEALLAKLGS